ncbi:hypothetical protein KGM_210002 [Danaus plexippus plexippus]|uniref:Uncharacterized protein n=1 Tax=Danaus plexippus plexippus TaxID=278856 RepID=A0A212FAR5_DANPL|nr:hypothetical protein KGM_210002 [Danaus plexippus plexippus]
MKTKHSKEEPDKIDEESVVEPKTRARKKASDLNEDDKTKSPQDDPKTSKDLKKTAPKPRAVVKKKPLGIRKTKTLRNKKVAIAKKNVLRKTVKRPRKAKTESDTSQDKDNILLIPAADIKKEPIEETTSNSRSSSPKTAGRRVRLSSDMVMMKSVLGDSPSSLVLGPRTSPYSMRSERSNSPSLFEGKNLRSGKPRKVKSNLLNEVMMKEQKKRRRLLSDSKTSEHTETDECRKSKRGRSCSRDGSEISKCSDITESDISLNEPIIDGESKELSKNLDKTKTDLVIDIENNVQISPIGKVPSLSVDSKLKSKQDAETSILKEKDKKKLSLKRSTSLDSDNNNSNRIRLENVDVPDLEEKYVLKTEESRETLLERSSILSSMSMTFNSKEVSKNIRKARRGKKAATTSRPIPNQANKNGITSTITNDLVEDKHETVDTLSKEISDLINDLDQNIDRDQQLTNESDVSSDQLQTKPVGDNNSIVAPETPIKDKDTISAISNECTPSKNDDSENIRLHYEEDSAEKCPDNRQEIAFKCTPVASIDKLMDRLKEFEELDKRRQRQESDSNPKTSEGKSVVILNDVVLIPKSGDIKPLKDLQPVRSPEKLIEKENVLSCFENNSAISIVKRDQVRRSIDVDLPNSVTLIKRNSVSARKESTSSNHSKESDAISIFEKSLGKDVTLTEIRKSVEKSAPQQIDLHQFATLHPNSPSQALANAIDSNQISITRNSDTKMHGSNSELQITKKSSVSLIRKQSESAIDGDEIMATIEKIKSPPHIKSPPPQIKSPPHQNKSPAVSVTPTPVSIKSPEASQPKEPEAIAPPLDNVKSMPEDISLTSEVPKLDSAITETAKTETVGEKVENSVKENIKMEKNSPDVDMDDDSRSMSPEPLPDDPKKPDPSESKPQEKSGQVKLSPKVKSARNSTETLPGPSNVILETPESQKRKENVLRTLGLLTHKAANEAKIEKLKEKERIYGPNYYAMGKGKASKSDYTGTLKTVIKLSRGVERDKKKYRSSLKMTFQKSKNRSGKPTLEVGDTANEDDSFYTIERREGCPGTASDGGHRKSHYSNRLNYDTDTVPEPEPKETLNLVIPEKASSFSIHPGRLCMDQCFYCGGKFGLFDTPCHIAQMKSSERQRKVLDNEEKLTIDSCLCDACYRHVDRRANCPSYRKRPVAKPPDTRAPTPPPANIEKPISPVEEESGEEVSGRLATCHTTGCLAPADHSIRRKWLIKMRSSVNKIFTKTPSKLFAAIALAKSIDLHLQLEVDYPGLHTIPLCSEHHRALAPLMACALCTRRLTKHHALHFIHHGFTDLNPLLSALNIPVQFTERPVLCQVCRYYCTLLTRPGHNDKHRTAYTRKLLQIYNIEIPPELSQDSDDTKVLEDCNNSANKQKKKARTKSKQRKSTEPEKTEVRESESSERTTESSPEKEKVKDDNTNMTPEEVKQNPIETKTQSTTQAQPIEEDIESLISSNKIPVPGAKPTESSPQSDASESDMVSDQETLTLPLDKQTELRYLLQKQNNPAQFQQKMNLTQKQKNILRIHNMGIQKPGLQHRINDKNTKRVQKIGQIVAHKEKVGRKDTDSETTEQDKNKEMFLLKNISLNDECTIETISNKKAADITTLKNKWQLSESFSQVKKNLSELSKKVPVDKEKKSDSKYSNPVKRLETNPSISVRELFPGEEEMNLQCNIEFNNVKGVTPEGWEKCNTLIQYDLETKKLWSELQRPYGNQSSFLRHLILLEKYFRSGDLVLSHNASPHAANYSSSVQSRLRAYDNTPPETTRKESVSLLEYRKKPSMNGKSLLKSNQNSEENPKKFMPPPGNLPKSKNKSEKKAKALPPELIAINTPNAQGRKSIQNVLHNIQQLVKGVSASDPTEVAASPLPPKEKKEMPGLKFDPPKEKKDKPEVKEKKEATPKKQKTNSKAWRPTLMPITPDDLTRIASEPRRTAIDGHSLPSLVQVISAGQRYHITFEDYNKMCKIRRDRQQRLQEKEAKARKSPEDKTVITEIQTSALLGNGGTVLQNIAADKDKKDPPELQVANAATILKSVGLRNITIAPITPKTATVTSHTPSASLTSPILVTTPIKLPQLGPAVSITSELATPIMPKIPKSLTVIPQTVVTQALAPPAQAAQPAQLAALHDGELRP